MNKIEIYTDGACSGNPGRGGIGAVILTDKSDRPAGTISMGYRLTTNNRMEILAAAEALDQIRANVPAKDLAHSVIVVHTDSQLLHGTMVLGWKRKANTDLWARMDRIMAALRSENVTVSFEKVKGHAGDRWNEEADRLAVAGTIDPAAIPDEGYKQQDGNVAMDAQLDLFRSPGTASGRVSAAVTQDDVRDWLTAHPTEAYRLLATLFAQRQLDFGRMAAEVSKTNDN